MLVNKDWPSCHTNAIVAARSCTDKMPFWYDDWSTVEQTFRLGTIAERHAGMTHHHVTMADVSLFCHEIFSSGEHSGKLSAREAASQSVEKDGRISSTRQML